MPVPAERFYNDVGLWMGRSKSVSVGLDYTCIVIQDNHYVCLMAQINRSTLAMMNPFTDFIDDDLDGFSTCDQDCDDSNPLLIFRFR